MKKIVSLMCAVMIIAIGVLSTSFNSNAGELNKGLEFQLNYAEPCTSDNQGYVSILTKDSSNKYYVITYFWNTIATVSGNESPAYAILSFNSTKFTFTIGGVNSSATGYYSLTQIGSLGNYVFMKSSSTESFTYDFSSLGRTIVGYKYKGNVGSVSGSFDLIPFTVYFSTDESSVLLRDIWDVIHSTYEQNEEILSDLEALYALQDNRLGQVVAWLESINRNTTLIDSHLTILLQRANELLEEQKQSNTWLGKIWDSLQEFINPDSSDKNKTDNYISESNTQKNEIDDLNNQNQVEKVDVNSAAAQVDSNINYDNMAEYGGVLATITNNQYILQLILVVVSVVIISYVLFGKR